MHTDCLRKIRSVVKKKKKTIGYRTYILIKRTIQIIFKRTAYIIT